MLANPMPELRLTLEPSCLKAMNILMMTIMPKPRSVIHLKSLIFEPYLQFHEDAWKPVLAQSYMLRREDGSIYIRLRGEQGFGSSRCCFHFRASNCS